MTVNNRKPKRCMCFDTHFPVQSPKITTSALPNKGVHEPFIYSRGLNVSFYLCPGSWKNPMHQNFHYEVRRVLVLHPCTKIYKRIHYVLTTSWFIDRICCKVDSCRWGEFKLVYMSHYLIILIEETALTSVVLPILK